MSKFPRELYEGLPDVEPVGIIGLPNHPRDKDGHKRIILVDRESSVRDRPWFLRVSIATAVWIEGGEEHWRIEYTNGLVKFWQVISSYELTEDEAFEQAERLAEVLIAVSALSERHRRQRPEASGGYGLGDR